MHLEEEFQMAEEAFDLDDLYNQLSMSPQSWIETNLEIQMAEGTLPGEPWQD